MGEVRGLQLRAVLMTIANIATDSAKTTGTAVPTILALLVPHPAHSSRSALLPLPPHLSVSISRQSSSWQNFGGVQNSEVQSLVLFCSVLC